MKTRQKTVCLNLALALFLLALSMILTGCNVESTKSSKETDETANDAGATGDDDNNGDEDANNENVKDANNNDIDSGNNKDSGNNNDSGNDNDANNEDSDAGQPDVGMPDANIDDTVCIGQADNTTVMIDDCTACICKDEKISECTALPCADECETSNDCYDKFGEPNIKCINAYWECTGNACEAHCGDVCACATDADCPVDTYCLNCQCLPTDSPCANMPDGSEVSAGDGCNVCICQGEMIAECTLVECAECIKAQDCYDAHGDVVLACVNAHWVCTTEYTCSAQCGGTSCSSQYDCKLSEECLNGICAPINICATSSDCPPRYYCDEPQAGPGTCTKLNDGECISDADCPPTGMCQSHGDLPGMCVPSSDDSCNSDSDCPAGYFCNNFIGPDNPGYCAEKTVDMCLDDSKCPPGYYCEQLDGSYMGKCQPNDIPKTCTSDYDCPPDRYCDYNTSSCEPVEPECVKEGDSINHTGGGKQDCCPGLVEIRLLAFDGSSPLGECLAPACDCWVCVKQCGDGQCTTGENWCNCPEDCKIR